MVNRVEVLEELNELLNTNEVPARIQLTSKLASLIIPDDTMRSAAEMRLTTLVLKEALSGDEGSTGPFPLLAAQHLLGFFEYPEDRKVPFGRVSRPLDAYDGAKDPTGPRAKGLRQTIAAIEGDYAPDRFAFVKKEGSRGVVADALYESIIKVIESPTFASLRAQAIAETASVTTAAEASTTAAPDVAPPSESFEEFSESLKSTWVSDSDMRAGRRPRKPTRKSDDSFGTWIRKKLSSRIKISPLVTISILIPIAIVPMAWILTDSFESGALRAISSAPSVTPTGKVEGGASEEYLGAWGPERPVFTWESPAPYAVLNSITDNPDFRDERDFVKVRQSMYSNVSFANIVRAKPGDELTVYFFVMNDASNNLADSPANIYDLRARLYLGQGDKDVSLGVVLSAENAASVWDGASVISSVPIGLTFVPGSMTVSSNDGDYVPTGDEMFQTSDRGMLLGHGQQDGVVPAGKDENGSNPTSFYVLFKVKVTASE